MNQEETALIKTAIESFTDDCLKIIDEKLYLDGEARCCEIHNADWSIAEDGHNCLGCTFSDMTDRIRSGLVHYRSSERIGECHTSLYQQPVSLC